MQTEVTLQLVFTINAKDEDATTAALDKAVSDLEGMGYDVMVEEEERLDDVYDMLEDDQGSFGFGGEDEW